MTQQQKRGQKRRQGIIVLALILLLSATGTFAWYSFNQRAVNPLWARTNYGGRIHDNFDGYRGYELDESDVRDEADAPNHTGGAGLRNKDVFAENFGQRPIYVRIQLLEYLAFEGVPLNNHDWDIDDPRGESGTGGWAPFRATDDDVNTRLAGPTAEIGAEGIVWTLGHDVNSDEANRGPKFFMPTFNRATHLVAEADVSTEIPGMFAHAQAFIMTDATGYGVEWLSTRSEVGRDVPEHEEILHASDFQIIGQQSAPGLVEAEHRLHDGFGLHDNWAEGDTLTSQRIHTPQVEGSDRHELIVEENDTPGNLFTHAAMETMRPSIYDVTDDQLLAEIGQTVDNFTGIMTLTNWRRLGFPDGNFWIHDNFDDNGWFYWNGLLHDGERPAEGVTNATSLLLDQIFVPTFDRSWEYVIVVEGEFFSGDSLDQVVRTPESDPIFNRDRDPINWHSSITVSGRGDVSYTGRLADEEIDPTVHPVYTAPDPETGEIIIRIPVDAVPEGANPNAYINRSVQDGWRERGPISQEPEDGYFIWIVYPPGPTCNIVWTDVPINLVRDGEGVLITEEAEPRLYCQTFFQDAPERITDAEPVFAIVGEETDGIDLDLDTLYVTADADAAPGGGRYVEVRFPTAPVAPTPAYVRRPIHVSFVTATACLENGYFIDEDVIWCRILEDGDYSLMITYNTHVIGGSDMRFGPVFEQWNDGPEIRATVENWFNTTASADLRADTVTGIIDNEAVSQSGNYWLNNNNISRPTTGTAGSGTAFLPSLSELNQFAGTPASQLHHGGDFQGIAHLGANAIGGNLVNGDLGVTWLRSPASPFGTLSWGWTLYSQFAATTVDDFDPGYGFITITMPDWEGFGFDDYGVRPTIWIQTNDWIDNTETITAP